MSKAIQTKVMKKDQSRVPHFVIPIIEGDLRDPLKKLTTSDTKMIMMAIKCFLHCMKWDFSFSRTTLSSLNSSELGGSALAANVPTEVL